MKVIKLYNTKTGWIAAHFVDGKPDPAMVDLFNTHLIPTAFTQAAEGSDVLEFTMKRNPTAEVTFMADDNLVKQCQELTGLSKGYIIWAANQIISTGLCQTIDSALAHMICQESEVSRVKP